VEGMGVCPYCPFIPSAMSVHNIPHTILEAYTEPAGTLTLGSPACRNVASKFLLLSYPVFRICYSTIDSLRHLLNDRCGECLCKTIDSDAVRQSEYVSLLWLL
jgi:hypothetical protein